MCAMPSSAINGAAMPFCEGLDRGDVVLLGPQVLPEHRGKPAVVTAVAASHCTVAVLDSERRCALDECWPGHGDVHVESAEGRLGSRVVISGLKSKTTAWCNELAGTVVEHPRQGHPCFVQRPGRGEPPLLVFCVRLDEPPPGRQRQVMMELRFLRPYGEVLAEAARNLECLSSSGLSSEEAARVASDAERVCSRPVLSGMPNKLNDSKACSSGSDKDGNDDDDRDTTASCCSSLDELGSSMDIGSRSSSFACPIPEPDDDGNTTDLPLLRPWACATSMQLFFDRLRLVHFAAVHVKAAVDFQYAVVRRWLLLRLPLRPIFARLRVLLLSSACIY